jgi:hypothetical protein
MVEKKQIFFWPRASRSSAGDIGATAMEEITRRTVTAFKQCNPSINKYFLA